MLAIAAPLISLVCFIVGMMDQIKIILTKGYSDELSVLRIFLLIFAGIIWILYGLEIENKWMVAVSVIGIIMNTALLLIIWHLRKNHKSP